MGNSTASGKGFEEMLELGSDRRVPKLNVIQAEGAAPLAQLFAGYARQSIGGAILTSGCMKTVENPHTLATAIKIGAPVSWRKSPARGVAIAAGRSSRERAGNRGRESHDRPRRNRLRTCVGHHGGGDQETRGCGTYPQRRSVIAVLTGHVLKDPDYVSQYHRGTLILDRRVAPRSASWVRFEMSPSGGGNKSRDSRGVSASRQGRQLVVTDASRT